ncbi:hypothetical protein DID80_02110 [Candidatus Marinamargulisbacteria bacterium SCGC AAA071-K20]|nr:hypothetical protein DID80_02110 [Candidatus Marinamargulisbacteria bacterium SCGC AAA071-K20]
MNKVKKFLIGLILMTLSCYTLVYSVEVPIVRIEANVSQTGVLANGVQEVTLTLYKGGLEASNVVWTETHPTVNFTDGTFGVDLGADVQFDPEYFNDPEIYFKLSINEDETLITVNAVPKSIFSDEAGLVEWTNVANIPESLFQESTVFTIDAVNGYFGIGTPTPDATLHVSGDVKIENLATSTLSNHTLLSSEGGLLKALDVSGQAERGLRVNSDASGFEFYQISDSQGLLH